MKVAVIGANGQLGVDVCRAFLEKGDEVLELDHDQIEITNFDSVQKILKENQPGMIVNTAAMHHVEKCEQDPERAFLVNGIAEKNLAYISREIHAVLIHISTDYVFNGKKGSPYFETDLPNPINVYGNTKLSGEHFIQSCAERYFILRTSALYGNSPCRAKGGLNFVQLMLKLARERGEVRVVDDERVSPTSTWELAKQIVILSHFEDYGLYHATAEGSCTWYEFAKEIFSQTGTQVKLSVADPNEFPMKVPRPKYSVLENQALKERKLNRFKHWSEALMDYLDGNKKHG